MITFNNIVERFRVFADAHFFVKSFSFGSPDDVDLSKFTNFPLMHLVYTGANYDAGTKTYNLEVYILDVPSDKTKKVDRQKEVVSDAEQCAEDIIADIKNGGNIFLFAQDYEVVNANTTPLEEETKNVLSGVLLDLSVAIPYEWDACNAPIDGVTPEGGDEVAYARRGILRMLTEDGATDVLSVRTIKVSNGTLTDDGDGVVTLDTGGATQLNDLDDVNISTLLEDQFLQYNGSQWENGTVVLATLSDVTGTPVDGKFLKRVDGSWQPADVSVAFENIEGVNLAGIDTNKVLLYNGAEWVPGNLPIVAFTGITSTSLGGGAIRLDVDAVQTFDIIQATGDLVIKVDSDNNQTGKALIIKDGLNAEVFRVSETGEVTVNQEYTFPTTDGTANQVLKTDGAGTVTFGDISIPEVSGLQPALNEKADVTDVPTELNDLTDVTITATPSANQALIYDITTSSFKSTDNFTNRFEDTTERGSSNITPFVERAYTVKSDGDGIFIDSQSDTPTAGKVIKRKIYHKTGFITETDVIGDYTLIHTFDDDTAYSATESTFEGFRDGDTYGTPPFTLIQTWEEETAAPTFTGLLNETYGSGAAAAYSVRRLNGLYTGAAIQVERSSDNTTQDIGFDANGDLDESALTTFCTGTVCKVRTWYDQSQTGGTGSGNDATQTDHALQPTIYTGGAINKFNGKVALKGSATSVQLNISSSLALNSDYGIFSLYTYSGSDMLFGGSIPTIGHWNNGGIVQRFDDNTNAVLSTSLSGRVLGYQNRASGTWQISAQGGTLASGTNTANFTLTMLFAGFSGQYDFNGNVQELLFYDTSRLSQRTSIQENIGDYFTQNTPLLDTYTGAAAAYSLRKLRTAYTGSAIRVRRASDNTEQDIGFNVFGELDTVSLASFCSGTNGFVKVWYDQASTNDATQTNTANQPKIYDSVTGVVTENGKPAVELDGTGDGFDISPAIAVASQKYIFTVHSIDSSDGQWTIFSETVSTDLVPIAQSGSSGAIVFGYTLNALYKDGGTAFSGTRNDLYNAYTSAGQSLTTIDFSGDGVGNLFRRASFETNGTAQEIVIYASDQSSNRTNIEDNINTFYSIY